MKEYITKAQVINDFIRNKINERLNVIFKVNKRKFSNIFEEDCVCRPTIRSVTAVHDGISSEYYVSLPIGTLLARIGDDPDDYSVEFTKEQIKFPKFKN